MSAEKKLLKRWLDPYKTKAMLDQLYRETIALLAEPGEDQEVVYDTRPFNQRYR